MAFKKLYRIAADATGLELYLVKNATTIDATLKAQAEQVIDYLYNYDELFTTQAQAVKHINSTLDALKSKFNLLSQKVDLSKVIYIDHGYVQCSHCDESLWSDDIQFHNCD